MENGKIQLICNHDMPIIPCSNLLAKIITKSYMTSHPHYYMDNNLFCLTLSPTQSNQSKIESNLYMKLINNELINEDTIDNWRQKSFGF